MFRSLLVRTLATTLLSSFVGCGQSTPDLNEYLDDPANAGNDAGFSEGGGEGGGGSEGRGENSEQIECKANRGQQCVPETDDSGRCGGPSVALGQVWNARTIGAEDSVDAPPCESQTAGSPDRSVTFKAPLAGTYAFAVVNADFDTVIHVRMGDCGGRVLACNDDADDTRLVSQVVLSLTAHQTVVVVVDGFAGATGAFGLRINRIETTCDDGIDDDGDGDVDCDDSDCADSCVVEDTWPPDWIAYEHALLSATNAVRAHGATCGDTYYPPALPVTVNTRVREAARGHALEMAEHDYFDHLGRDGSTFDVRMTRAGYAGRPPWAENLVAGRPDAQSAISALMDSPQHCRNIMHAQFRVVGIGYAYSEKSRFGHLAAQNFGGGD